MKRILLTLMTLLGVTGMWAQVSFPDVEVRLGSTGTLEVVMAASETPYNSLQFKLNLPEGITVPVMTSEDPEGNEVSQPDGVVGEAATSHMISSNYNNESEPQVITYTLYNMLGYNFLKAGGVVARIKLEASETKVNVGDVLTATLTEVSYGAADGTAVTESDITFNITIVENRNILDENEGITEETETGTQNVLVKRTIKANQWSTLVLPFAMTADQVAEAFGDGVKLAEFTGCTTVNNEDYEATSIKVNFESLTEKAIEANHPYIIFVESDIAEFKVDGVDVNPDEKAASVDCDEYTTGSGTKKDPYVYHYNSFVGTYDAETVLDDKDILFISGNKFYYSNGSTKMKAFRGYFEFYDVLADKSVSSAKIGYSVNDEATSIDGLPTTLRVAEGVYDLSGRKIQVENGDVNTLQKGVYIIDGKKVTIK